MRVKEMIHKIESHPVYDNFEKLVSCTKSEFYKNKYDIDIFLYPDYTKQLYYYRFDNMYKQIPKFEKEFNLQYGLLDLKIYFGVRIDPYSRTKADIETYVRFYSNKRHHYKLIESINEEVKSLSLNFDLENPEKQIKEILNRYIIAEGYMNYIQSETGCKINQISHFYKLFKKYNDIMNSSICYDTLEKWIKRNFNVISNGYIHEAINFVNKHGKQEKLTTLCKFDYSSFNSFDGDVSDMELLYWEEIEQYPSNTVFIN